MSRPRSRARRWLLVPFLLVLLELTLQLAAPLVQMSVGRRDAPPLADAAFEVLCVGDSNTFGLHLPRAYAYPAQLQARLQRRFAGPVSVINRGVPGQNAAQVAAHLADDLAGREPDVVIALAGINDTWNDTGRADRGPWSWLGALRTVRLVRVLASGVTTATPFEVRTEGGEMVVDRGDGAEPVAAREGTAGTLAGETLAERVRTSFERILATCRDHGAALVVMTYPDPHLEYPTVSHALASFAAEHDLPLVDHAAAFEEHFEREGYPTLMFTDHHPNLRGYELMVDGIVEELAAHRLVPAIERVDADAPSPAPPGPRPRVVPLSATSLELIGPAGAAFQLVVGHAPSAAAPPVAVGDVTLPVAADAALERSRLEPGFSGTLGTDGRARVRVPEDLLAAAAQAPLRACLVLLHAPGAGPPGGVAAVSDPVDLPR